MVSSGDVAKIQKHQTSPIDIVTDKDSVDQLQVDESTKVPVKKKISRENTEDQKYR